MTISKGLPQPFVRAGRRTPPARTSPAIIKGGASAAVSWAKSRSVGVLATSALLLVLALPAVAQRVVVVPPQPNPVPGYVNDMVKRNAAEAEAKRQREHEAELQRREHEQRTRELATLTQTGQPQPPPISWEKSSGRTNGRAWLSWPEILRAGYIVAMYDTAPIWSRDLDCAATYSEVIDGITRLYNDDPALRILPIYDVARIFAASSRGATAEEIATIRTNALRAINSSSRQ
jgi:hypothetical protein